MNKKISEKDKKDWEDFLKSKDKLIDKDSKVKKKIPSYSERTIDLHGYTLENANLEIEKFISACFDKGVKKINVITGKGTRSKNIEDPYQSKDLSILKYSVPNYIKENQNIMKKVLKIDLDAVESPNKGSFEIVLRKKND